MSTSGGENPANGFAFEVYGVRLGVRASSDEILEGVRSYLPPGWAPCAFDEVERVYAITGDQVHGYAITRDGSALVGGRSLTLELALEILDTQLRVHIGRYSPDMIFVHAGVVAHAGHAVVVPAPSFGGKTTLVAALVRAGALYLSDEFAVLDEQGRVHPYAKRLSIRDGYEQTEHEVSQLGGTAAAQDFAVAMIVVTTYQAGARWQPRTQSAGAGAMALLANAVPAQERPGQVLRFISRAAQDAVVLEGERGEADLIAPLLLEQLERLETPRA